MLELLKQLNENTIGSTDDDPGELPDNTGKRVNNNTQVTERELYLKLYGFVKASIISKTDIFSLPIGWYSVVDENGNEVKILVYDCQFDAYKDIEDNLNFINEIEVNSLIDIYYNIAAIKPDEKELAYLLDYIDEMNMMPTYFTFRQRDALDPTKLADKVNTLFAKEEDKEAWLKELFEKSSILRQIYKYFYAFKKSVFDASKEEKKSQIVAKDIKEEYVYEENYFKLQELLQEVIKMYPKLRTDGLVKLGWSENVVKGWFALCQRFDKKEGLFYQIHINKILSSPKVDREVIKYLIFHELLHQNGYWNHDEGFRKREWQYPNEAELDVFLDSLCIHYNLEIHYEHAKFYEIPILESDLQFKNDYDKSIENDSLGIIEFNKDAKGVAEGFKYCRNCGNRLPNDAKFCDKCGTKIEY